MTFFLQSRLSRLIDAPAICLSLAAILFLTLAPHFQLGSIAAPYQSTFVAAAVIILVLFGPWTVEVLLGCLFVGYGEFRNRLAWQDFITGFVAFYGSLLF